jgi:heme/copper-type cytochrome/quinol oxidase subunit 3
MKTRRMVLFSILAALLLLLVAVEPALAQCAMCKAAIENSADAEEASRGLSLASLVLLIPPVAIFSGLFGVFYHFRNVQGKSGHPPVNL